MSGAGPGSQLAPAVTDWRLVLLSAGVGAVIAGAIYVLVLRWGRWHHRQMLQMNYVIKLTYLYSESVIYVCRM